MTDRTIIGQKIAYLRKMKGLTQAELAERLGVSPQAVSQWERSETLPDILTLPKIAEIFEEGIAAILGVEELNAEKVPAETEEIPADNSRGTYDFKGFIYCGIDFDGDERSKETMSEIDAKKLVV